MPLDRLVCSVARIWRHVSYQLANSDRASDSSMKPMAEKSANKGSEPAKNGQEEGLHETLLSSADKVRQALGAWAAKL